MARLSKKTVYILTLQALLLSRAVGQTIMCIKENHATEPAVQDQILYTAVD